MHLELRAEAVMTKAPYFYETQVYWEGERRGVVEFGDLAPIVVSAPSELGGEPGFWTPEQLLVSAAETCLMESFLAIADRSHLPIVSYRSSAFAKLEHVSGRQLVFTKLWVRPVIEIERTTDRRRAAGVLESARAACSVTSALRLPIEVEPQIISADRSHCVQPVEERASAQW